MAKKKYYAVKRGKTPGIYLTWEDCRSQISGFSGAVYKGFERFCSRPAGERPRQRALSGSRKCRRSAVVYWLLEKERPWHMWMAAIM